MNLKNKSKDKLILIVGDSGSGKTTIAKELEKLDYNIIHSYTDRKPREENEWGHTFVSTQDYVENYKLSDNIIALFKGYNYIYWAVKEQYQDKGTSIYVIDPGGAKQVQESVDDAEVITIYLKVDLENRYQRMMETRGVNETYTRLTSDKDIFKVVKCDYMVDCNREIPDVLEDILDIIK